MAGVPGAEMSDMNGCQKKDIYIWKYKETMDFSFDFMALKISKQVSDRFLVSMAMILIFELSKEV